ncbi:hypothetical protein F5Y16DRAFT_404733 [Xylariaceae sp. FL0255]|nr:hypothetical protein F5Y16DRAFT_404733 [Xylariaceae sp. FL0255]
MSYSLLAQKTLRKRLHTIRVSGRLVREKPDELDNLKNSPDLEGTIDNRWLLERMRRLKCNPFTINAVKLHRHRAKSILERHYQSEPTILMDLYDLCEWLKDFTRDQFTRNSPEYLPTPLSIAIDITEAMFGDIQSMTKKNPLLKSTPRTNCLIHARDHLRDLFLFEVPSMQTDKVIPKEIRQITASLDCFLCLAGWVNIWNTPHPRKIRKLVETRESRRCACQTGLDTRVKDRVDLARVWAVKRDKIWAQKWALDLKPGEVAVSSKLCKEALAEERSEEVTPSSKPKFRKFLRAFRPFPKPIAADGTESPSFDIPLEGLRVQAARKRDFLKMLYKPRHGGRDNGKEKRRRSV